MKRNIDHSLVHKIRDCCTEDCVIPKDTLESHPEIITSRLNDTYFCGIDLYFVPSKNMGFSVFQEYGCSNIGGQTGFLYPHHVRALHEACEKMLKQMEEWEK